MTQSRMIRAPRSNVEPIMENDNPVITVGHSTRTIAEFADALRFASVSLVVDVRTVPKSRRNPQYNETMLGDELEPYQIGYTRLAGLGGLRGKSREVPETINAFWDNRSFHNYADYALSDEFGEALAELLELSRSRRCAIMCAEAVWWRCHRRIITDYLLARGKPVLHLMGSDRLDPARMTPGAVVEGDKIVYPAAE